jgi:hypothetical protein
MSRIPDSVEAIEKMPWDEMHSLFASIFVEEIAGIQDCGGEQFLREKLAGFTDAQRTVLRRALVEPTLS